MMYLRPNNMYVGETICPKCHKPYVYVGDPFSWSRGMEPYCTCSRIEYTPEIVTPVGWICPRCKKVISPYVNICPNCDNNISITTSTYSDNS